MAQFLVRAWGPPAAQATAEQVRSMQRCCQQLRQDARVKSLHGLAEQSDQGIAVAAIVEAASAQEAQSIAGLTQPGGFTSTHVAPLIPAEQLQATLEQAQRQASPEHAAHRPA